MDGTPFWWSRLLHLVFICLLLLPLIMLMYFIFLKYKQRLSNKAFLGFGTLFSLFSIPILFILLVFPTGVQSLLSFGVYSSIRVLNYQVVFVEPPCFIDKECERYFEITRDDGTQSRAFIDGDSDRCNNPRTVIKEQKAYFLCSDEQFSDIVAYVNIEKYTVFTGYSRQLLSLDGLYHVDK